MKIKNLLKVYGRSVNDVLSEQGIDNQDHVVSKEIDQLFSIIEDRDFTEAKILLEILEKKLGKNHPDLLRANYLINLYS